MILSFAALLLTATLFGGMILYSFGFAPFLFRTVPVEEAGRMLRQAFPWYYAFVLATAVVACALLAATDRRAAIVMALVALIALYARQGLMPAINRARDAQMAGSAGAKARFGRLHGFSVILNFVQLGAIGWILYRFL